MRQRYAFLGAVKLHPSAGCRLGQLITDPAILAKVNLAESYGEAVKAISRVANVTLEQMAGTSGNAKAVFQKFLGNISFMGYVMKILVLSAVIVKWKIPALGLAPQQLANILVGGEGAVREILSEAEVGTQLKVYEEEIIAKAPENIRIEVRKLIEESGITPENLTPNVPEGAVREELSPKAAPVGLTGLEKAALVGVPVVVLAVVAFALKN